MKLFISHGGMSGIYEAIDSGVPVLGIPLFFDQPHNIANVVHWGAGEMLDYKTLTKDKLVYTIKHMMKNYDKCVHYYHCFVNILFINKFILFDTYIL